MTADTARLTPSIAERLTAPARTLPLADLPHCWFHVVIDILCRDAAPLAGDPAVPGKIRGAWGAALMEAASAEALAGQPCPWSPPCALDPLFREQGALTPGLAVPKPFVLAVRPDGDDARIELTLFGFATDWAEAAGDALVRALRRGLSLPGGHDGLVIMDRAIRVAEAVPLPPAGRTAILHFRTPVALRSGEFLHGTLRPLLSSLGNRISGLARWQDCAVAADWRGLKDHAAGLRLDDSRLRPVGWRRQSHRQGGRVMDMGGLCGTLMIDGDLEPILPLLALGRICHVGSHAALGMGGYDLQILA